MFDVFFYIVALENFLVLMFLSPFLTALNIILLSKIFFHFFHFL